MSAGARNWSSARLVELCELNPKTQAEDHLMAGFTPMQMLGVRYGDVLGYEPRPWGEIKKAYTHFQSGDVLLAKVTPCFENGKAGIASGLPNNIGAGSSEIYALRPADGIDCRYLLAYLSTDDFRRRATMAMTGAVGLRRVPREFLLNECLPVAPVAEQQRIADKLDTVLARVDAVNTRLVRVAPLLKRFRQSVLEQLTVADNTGSKFATRALRELVREPLRNGKSVPDGDGLPVLRLSALRGHREIDLGEHKLGAWGDLNAARFLVVNGDFLVARGNGSKDLVGRGGLVSGCSDDIAYPDTMIRIRPDDQEVLPEYLRMVWNSSAIRLQIEAAAKTTAGIWKISQGDLEEIQIPLPSTVAQTEIVRRIDTLFAFADRLEARLQAAQAAATRLTPALLAKAFRGELVPQDPADEPATELLRRLAEQRAQAAPARPRRGRAGA